VFCFYLFNKMSVPKEHKRYSFDGDVVHIELTDDGYMPPETARYYIKTRTATQDQSVVGGYCGIRDFDAYISPTKYKAYRNNLPNRNGAPYDYVPYMKRRHEIPCGRPVGNMDGSIAKQTNNVEDAPVSDHQRTSEQQPRNSYESRKSSIKQPYPAEDLRNSNEYKRSSMKDSVEKSRNSYVADRVSAVGQLSGKETGNSRPLSIDHTTTENKEQENHSRRSSVNQNNHTTDNNRNSAASNRNSADNNRNSAGSNRVSTGSNRNSADNNRNSAGSNRVSTGSNN